MSWNERCIALELLNDFIRASPIIEPSVWLLAKLQEPNYTIVISYLSIRNFFIVV